MISQTDYANLLPFEGRNLHSSTGDWTLQISGLPNPVATDRLLYKLLLTKPDAEGRQLRLWLSDASLHHDRDGSYKNRILSVISRWLERVEVQGEIKIFE